MTTSRLAARVSDELLPRVRQPAQYIGGELNQLPAPGAWETADVRVVIGFPDAYTIGMSHLGCQILYWLCNRMPGVVAERTYCPWTDAEQVMRERGIPLFTWDTRQPVVSADIFAISMQYELCFTSILQLLDLAGIPLTAAERSVSGPAVPAADPSRGVPAPVSSGGSVNPPRDWPLIVVGGPQADNPEPMADFVDLVVMGDGEHSMAALVEAVRALKLGGARRDEMILELARRFPWVYAPNLYEASYRPDSTLAAITPTATGLPTTIERCQTPDFEAVPFPTRPLVPWVEVVHDRIGIEIMRGCPQVCRFCHAGFTKRPLNLRSVDRIMEIAEEAYAATGQHELGLLSLSTADYPHLKDLAARVNEQFGGRRVSPSFPSLRVDKMLANIPWMANQVRKGSLTMAVEAARDDMRRAIRKKVTDGNLLEGVREVYKAGWKRIKLYFMCGFPGEREEDVRGIWECAEAVSMERRATGRPPGHVTASVGWLVPKPFTPFQWMAQPTVDYFYECRRMLARIAKRKSAVKLRTHKPERSILEGVFARGDRRLGKVVLEAYRRGARFDGWDEAYDDRIWQEAYAATGIDPAWYAHRERALDEHLPWEHIGLHMRRGYLEEAYADVFEQIGVRRPDPGIIRRAGPIRPEDADRLPARRGLPVVG